MHRPRFTAMFTAASAALFALVAVSPSTFAADGPLGLVGHWEFDDGTGRDSSGNGNDAELGGAEVYSLGEGKGCIRFMADDVEPMRIPASEDSPLAIERGTITFWMSTTSDRSGILAYDNDAVEINNYRGCLQPRFEGEDEFEYGSGILDYDWPKYDMREWAFYPHIKASVGDSEWHLFAVAYDDSNKTITGWRDGELISIVDLSTVDVEPLVREDLSEIVSGDEFVGYLDDLRIFDTVLTDTDIQGIYESTKEIYAGRRDVTDFPRKQMEIYEYQDEDQTLYAAWLQNQAPGESDAPELLRHIVAEGSNTTIQTAAGELTAAIEAMYGIEPSVVDDANAGSRLVIGTTETSVWIRDRAGALGLDRIENDGFVIKAMDDGDTRALVIAGDIPAGVVFGAFDLIRRIQLGQNPNELDVLENPQIPIRMVDHWSYFRGVFGDRWRSSSRDESIYSWEELRTGDTKLIRDWVRLMASAGWNAICPSEVNWHYRNNFLDHLDEVEVLAGILRDYGMKLYWSPSYLLALEKDTADQIYARVPDFGGYMMKLGSEKQNGDPRPPTVNRIADTVKAHGGMVLVRAFVYGNSRYTDEPYRNLIPHDIFAPEDGNFRDNVIIVPKGSPLDWDLSAPIPALDGAIRKNLSGSEMVIDKDFPSSWVEKWKWWMEQDNYHQGPGSLNKLDVDCIMGVSMISPAPAWTECPLNMVNYYGLGRLAWNPDQSLDTIYTEWIAQTFGADPDVLNTIKTILLISDDVTRKLCTYRGYRGIWIDDGSDNMVQSKTPHTVTQDGIGPATPELQARILAQYAPGLQDVYGDPLRGEQFLTSFHFVGLDERLSIGRTLIQDVFGNLEEAVVLAEQMVGLWKSLEGKIDARRFEYTLDVLEDSLEDAQEDRDAMAAGFEKATGRQRDAVLAGLTREGLAEVGTFNVRHFGAVGDGASNDTEAIAQTIAACDQAGGGTVFIPTGIYAVATVALKSNISFVLDQGAVLKTMADRDGIHHGRSLILGEDLENVRILGPGTVDGATVGTGNRSDGNELQACIRISGCSNVEIYNLNVLEGNRDAVASDQCTDVRIDNVTISARRRGIHLENSRDIEIAYCQIDSEQATDMNAGDDTPAARAGSPFDTAQSKNVTIHHTSAVDPASAIRLDGQRVVENVTVLPR